MIEHELRCERCLYARRKAHCGTVLEYGHVRCAHPVTKTGCALVSGDRESAAGHLKIRGPMSLTDQRRTRFRWPWDFEAALLVHCSGFEKRGI